MSEHGMASDAKDKYFDEYEAPTDDLRAADIAARAAYACYCRFLQAGPCNGRTLTRQTYSKHKLGNYEMFHVGNLPSENLPGQNVTRYQPDTEIRNPTKKRKFRQDIATPQVLATLTPGEIPTPRISTATTPVRQDDKKEIESLRQQLEKSMKLTQELEDAYSEMKQTCIRMSAKLRAQTGSSM
jgi:hypothetical protein